MLRKKKECWVISESDLDQISTRSLTSSNQSWYARNTWKHSISRSHAEATLSDEICRNTWKWSDEQDDQQCTWFIFIANWALMH